MTVARVLLLVIGVAGALFRPFRLPPWVLPLGCAIAAVSIGAISWGGSRAALDPLVEPIAFLLAAVPFAILLDRLGFFSSLAEVLTATGRGSGGLWALAALVTTVLNLDAAVVLLTPLYVRVARRTGRDPRVLAFQPVLLACLASSALPVSNLTNLIATSWTGADTAGFVTHLALPSLAATSVGWWRYRTVMRPDDLLLARVDPVDHPDRIGGGQVDASMSRPGSLRPRRPGLVSGGIVVGLVLIGFVAGPSVGIKPWMVAAAGDVFLLAFVRQMPWRHIPLGTAVVAGSLGVLAASAVAHFDVARVVGGRGTASLAVTIGATAAAANVMNNLPALLVSLPAVGHHPTPALWAVLIGVNMGPVLLVTGSLASLLWLDALAGLGVPVRARDFTRVGLLVGLPGALAGAAVFLVLSVAIH